MSHRRVQHRKARHKRPSVASALSRRRRLMGLAAVATAAVVAGGVVAVLANGSTPGDSGQHAGSPHPSSTLPLPDASSGSAIQTDAAAAVGRGSVPVGQAAYAIPAGALFVAAVTGNDAGSGSIRNPLRTISAAVSRAGAGQTIVVRGGTYHETVEVSASKVGLVIQSYPHEAVWLDGSVPVVNWVKHGAVWVASGWGAQFDHSASFVEGSAAGNFVGPNKMAAYPDQLFFGTTQLTQVPPATVPGAGQFSVNYAAKTLTTGSDPTLADVRASDLSIAMTVSATNVALRGIGVRRFANSLPAGPAIYLARQGDSIQNVVVTDIATQGIGFYKGAVSVDHVTVTGSGLLGISGTIADGSSIENSIVSGSNSQHFNSAPSSAAVKITRSRRITIRNNDLSDNLDAAGLWLDESVVSFLVVHNSLRNNGDVANIQLELSDTGVVADNIVQGSDRGVYVYDTGNVQIYNNTFGRNSRGSVYLSQDNRREATPGPNHDPRQPIPDATCPWLVRNITVANNIFAFNGGDYGFQFYALDTWTHIGASAMHIVIKGNLFHQRASSTDTMVAWGAADNTTITRYESPSALAAGLRVNWSNVQIPGTTTTALDQFVAQAKSQAIPLPVDVAAAVGQDVGHQQVGTF